MLLSSTVVMMVMVKPFAIIAMTTMLTKMPTTGVSNHSKDHSHDENAALIPLRIAAAVSTVCSSTFPNVPSAHILHINYIPPVFLFVAGVA